MFIQTEATPNPEVLKFLPGREVLGADVREFTTLDEAATSPLALGLFEVAGVRRVFLGSDFLTVTKAPDLEWRQLKAPILAAIMEHFTSGAPVIAGAAAPADAHADKVYDGDTAQIVADKAGAEGAAATEDDEVVAQIKELLETRVRPAVAQDGGDIIFQDFRDGVVYLHLQGSCSGCPSSTATLKMGIENMLKHYVPEVTRVEQTL